MAHTRRWHKLLVAGRGVAAALALVLLMRPMPTKALELPARSLSVGSSLASATTTHTVSFTFPDASVTGSITFEYCQTPLMQEPCVPPNGLDASRATLQSQSGETGFAIESQDENEITLSRPPTAVNNDAVQYVFANVVNPSTPLQTFYMRIATYSDSSGSGTPTDFGTVASATTSAVSVSTQVPPILDFCVGLSVSSGCASSTGNFAQLGDLSTITTARTTSQMAAGTNADSGLVITANGPTMTSGNNTIPALAQATRSVAGSSQFGVNLRSNSDPPVGSDPGSGGIIVPTTNYDTPNEFAYNNGAVVAASAGPTNLETLTVSYLINISPAQPVGIYDTTITYICTASF